jgi:capsular polysaccharide biosynthesis protein
MMTRNEFKLQRLLGDIELLEQPRRAFVERHADSIRKMINDAGNDRHLVFVALALVSAEQMVSYGGTQ